MLVAGCHDGLRLYRLEARLQPSDAPLTVSDPHVPSQPAQADEQQQDIPHQGAMHLHIAVELLSQVRRSMVCERWAVCRKHHGAFRLAILTSTTTEPVCLCHSTP